jgi:nucleotide-binding universal stress UspA family protein
MNAPLLTESARSSQCWQYEQQVPGGIVIGVDGSRQSIAALNTAAALARARHCPLHAVTVLDQAKANRVGSHTSFELGVLMNALDPPADWTHEVTAGRPARSLASIAERRGAGMIVLGRHDHPVVDRVLGGETTLQVIRSSALPVLTVGTEIQRPRRIVVATDFSEASAKAAELAHELIAVSGTVYLAYVECGMTTAGEQITEGEARHPGDVMEWFRRLMGKLRVRNGVLVEPITLTGSAAPAIMNFADRVGADLIAAGSHGRNMMERWLLGSISTRLVREAQCGVLIAPPALASVLSFRT